MNNEAEVGFVLKRDEIQYYTLELLNDGKEYSRSAIKKHVVEKSGKQFPEGTFSGALRNLALNNANVISPKTGYYKFVEQESGDEGDLHQLLTVTLEEFIHDFNKLTTETIERFISKVNELPAETLKKSINELVKDMEPLRVNDEEKTLNVLKDTLKNLELSISEIESRKSTKGNY